MSRSLNKPHPTETLRAADAKEARLAMQEWFREHHALGYYPPGELMDHAIELLTRTGRTRLTVGGQDLLVTLETTAAPEGNSGAA